MVRQNLDNNELFVLELIAMQKKDSRKALDTGLRIYLRLHQKEQTESLKNEAKAHEVTSLDRITAK